MPGTTFPLEVQPRIPAELVRLQEMANDLFDMVGSGQVKIRIDQRYALADVAQLRGLIDQELRDDINEEFEDQILTGDGVGENFTGILNTAGILTIAWDTDAFVTSRRAKAYLMTTAHTRPTAWVLRSSSGPTSATSWWRP